MPTDSSASTTGDDKQWLDLPAWRETHGWDKNGAIGDMQIDFDPDRLELTISRQPALPKGALPSITSINDMFGNATGETRAPGPLADPGAKHMSGS